MMFMDGFDGDRYAFHRKDFPYYPFQSCKEWELALFLLCLDLSMKKLDEFFNLNIVSPFITFSRSYFNEFQVKKLSLSFMSAKTLHSLAKMLSSGPRWKHRIWKLGILQRMLCAFIIGILLNAFNSFWRAPFQRII